MKNAAPANQWNISEAVSVAEQQQPVTQ